MLEDEKAAITELVYSLIDDEPFDGDAVTELSRYFVILLCKQSGEEDQIRYILKPRPHGCPEPLEYER